MIEMLLPVRVHAQHDMRIPRDRASQASRLRGLAGWYARQGSHVHSTSHLGGTAD